MFDVDWHKLFVPSASLAEIFIRGTVIYLALFAAMRLLPRRTIGSMGASDVLVIVLISETVSNAMQGGAEAITDGILLAAVVWGWAQLIDWLDFKLPHANIASAQPLEMVRDGRLLRDNMAKQHVTEDEILSQLREHGLDSPKGVVRAYLEGDGHLSVIVRSRAPLKPPSRRDQP